VCTAGRPYRWWKGGCGHDGFPENVSCALPGAESLNKVGVCAALAASRGWGGINGENPKPVVQAHAVASDFEAARRSVFQEIYLESLGVLGIDLRKHDLKFEEDNWESPTLGALGYWLAGDAGWVLEITQFTYFQQCGGVDLESEFRRS